MSYPYGQPGYGQGPYGGRVSVSSLVNPWGITVVIYDKNWLPKGFYQTGSGTLMGVEFSHDENGCLDFTLHFGTYANLIKGDLIKIYVFDVEDPFYTGVVRRVPLFGSTAQTYDYAGYGLNDYLVRLNSGELTYSSQTIAYIIGQFAAIMTASGKITVNPIKIVAPTTVVTQIKFHYVTLSDALSNVQKIANADGNDYLYGIDEAGEFFFRPRRTDTIVTLIQGVNARYGLEHYEPKDGSQEPVTKLHVFKSDGTFFADYTTTDGTLDVNEQKLTAPDGLSTADIPSWALGQLLILQQSPIEATVDWHVWRQQPLRLFGDGYVRVICNRPPTTKNVSSTAWGAGAWGAGYWGGAPAYTGYARDDTLKVKKVVYKFTGSMAERTMELGALPIQLDREMIKINKNIEDLRVSSGR